MSIPQSAPRIGLGTDRHRLVNGRPCILGGVTIDCQVGPFGHSDADAVLHAVCDALLGAAGLDDLGTLFPDTDPQWKDASSVDLLADVLAQLNAQSLQPLSLDIAVHCNRPKIGPYRAAIRANLSNWLGLPVDRVNIKGKTLEGIDADREYVDVTAVVLLTTQAGL
jgi:2-C-methyl-D-erythritol 2,4-cyclodiphosphate synthase